MFEAKLSKEKWQKIVLCLEACGQLELARELSAMTRVPIYTSGVIVFLKRAAARYATISGE